MTVDKGFKRIVRTRARRTGESYVAARRAFLASEGGSPMGASASTAKLYGLSDLLLTDEQIPAGFELRREWSGPINRHYEGPTFEAQGFIRDNPGDEPPKAWPVPPRSVEAKIKPFLVELGLQGGYMRSWQEKDLQPDTAGQSISNHILELRDAEAARRNIAHGRDDLAAVNVATGELLSRSHGDSLTFVPEFVDPATYRDSVMPIGEVATMIGVGFCVAHIVCSVMIMMRSRDEAFEVARGLIGPYVKFVYDADPANRLE